jgi:hypothetical protein
MPFQNTDTLANQANGPGFVYYTADLTVAVPAKIDDIVKMASPYTPQTGWIDGGMITRDAISIATALTVVKFMTGHTNVPVGERVTATSRTAGAKFEEITPSLLAMLENAEAPQTIAAGTTGSGTPAQSRVRLGNTASLARHRFAIVWERDPSLTGVFGEGGARGLLMAYVLCNAAISKGLTFALSPDTVSNLDVEFEAFPEPTLTDPRQQHGFWVAETGTVVP